LISWRLDPSASGPGAPGKQERHDLDLQSTRESFHRAEPHVPPPALLDLFDEGRSEFAAGRQCFDRPPPCKAMPAHVLGQNELYGPATVLTMAGGFFAARCSSGTALAGSASRCGFARSHWH
jgi:hypothetical protein